MPGVRCRRVTRPIGPALIYFFNQEHVTQLALRQQVVYTLASTGTDAILAFACWWQVFRVCVQSSSAGGCDGWMRHARRCGGHLRAGRDGGAALEHAHDGGARGHRRLHNGRHGNTPPG